MSSEVCISQPCLYGCVPPASCAEPAARLLPARMMNPSCLYFYLSLLSNFDEVRPFFVSKTNSEFELILTSIYNPPRARAESDTLLVAEEERVSSDHNFIHPHSSAIFNSSNWFLWLSLRSDAKYFGVWIMNRIEIKVRSLCFSDSRHDKVWNNISLLVHTRLGCRASHEISQRLK